MMLYIERAVVFDPLLVRYLMKKGFDTNKVPEDVAKYIKSI